MAEKSERVAVFSERLSKKNELIEKVKKVVESYNHHKAEAEKVMEEWRALVHNHAEKMLRMIDSHHRQTMMELDEEMELCCNEISQHLTSATTAEQDLDEFASGMSAFVRELLN